jgi:hypothetical protein
VLGIGRFLGGGVIEEKTWYYFNLLSTLSLSCVLGTDDVFLFDEFPFVYTLTSGIAEGKIIYKIMNLDVVTMFCNS